MCVNQRLFITNAGPPRGVYTCPHKEGYDVTLSLLVVCILTVPSQSPQLPPTPPPIHFAHLLPLSARPPQAVSISAVCPKCPWSLTSLGSIASKFKTAVGKSAGGEPGVQLSLPVVVSCVHSVPGTYGLASIDIVDRGVGVSATSTRGSGVLSMMMSGFNIENVNGGGRSRFFLSASRLFAGSLLLPTACLLRRLYCTSGNLVLSDGSEDGTEVSGKL